MSFSLDPSIPILSASPIHPDQYSSYALSTSNGNDPPLIIGYVGIRTPLQSSLLPRGEGELWPIWKEKLEQDGGLAGRRVILLVATGQSDQSSPMESGNEEGSASAYINHSRAVTRWLIEQGSMTVICPHGVPTAIENNHNRSVNGNDDDEEYNVLLIGCALEAEERHIPAFALSAPTRTVFSCVKETQLGCHGKDLLLGGRRFNYLHSLSSPTTSYFSSFVHLLNMQKGTSLAIISHRSKNPFYKDLVFGAKTAAKDHNIQVVSEVYLDDDDDDNNNNNNTAIGITNAGIDLLPDIIHRLIQADPDGVILATKHCEQFLEMIAALDYLPRAIAALSNCVGDFPNQDQDQDKHSKYDHDHYKNIRKYIFSPVQWIPDERLNGPDYRENELLSPYTMLNDLGFSTMLNRTSHISGAHRVLDRNVTMSINCFLEKYRKWNPQKTKNPNDVVISYFSALWFFHIAIVQLAASGDVNDSPWESSRNESDFGLRLNNKFQSMYEPSPFGLLSSFPNGINVQKKMILIQRDNMDTVQLVAPFEVATAGMIYPMPKWNERTFTLILFSENIERLVIAIAFLLTLFCLFAFVMAIVHRNHNAMKGVSLVHHCVMLIGCMIGILGSVTWSLNTTLFMCMIRPWMWTVGYHLFMTIVLVRLFRIDYITKGIFNEGLERPPKISDGMVLFMSFVVFSPQLIISIIFDIKYPFHVTVLTPDPLRPAYSFTECTSVRSIYDIFFSGLYCMLIAICAVILAIRIRRRHQRHYHRRPYAYIGVYYEDPRLISLTSYICSVAIILANLAYLSMPFSESTRVPHFILRSLLLYAFYGAGLITLFLPRLYGIFLHQKKGDESEEETVKGNTLVTEVVNMRNVELEREIQEWKAKYEAARRAGKLSQLTMPSYLEHNFFRKNRVYVQPNNNNNHIHRNNQDNNNNNNNNLINASRLYENDSKLNETKEFVAIPTFHYSSQSQLDYIK